MTATKHVAVITQTNNDTAQTTAAVRHPDYIDGDLIIQWWGSDDDDAVTAATSGANGETLLHSFTGDSGSGAGPVVGVIAWVGDATITAGTQNWTIAAAEHWHVHTLKIRRGAFDATTPIASNSAVAGNSANSTNVPTPAWTAGSTAGQTVMCGLVTDADPILTVPSDWRIISGNDTGSVAGSVAIRDTTTTASESISSVNFTIASDTSSTYGITLNPHSNPVVTSVNASRNSRHFSWGDTSVTIEGENFESTQGTGVVEVWNSELGTTQQVTNR